MRNARSTRSVAGLRRGSTSPDEIAGHTAVGGARRRRRIGVLDLLSILRIQRFAIAEHGLAWKVVQLDEFVEERVLIGREVRHAVTGLVPFEAGGAWVTVVERHL